jgi:hypothetical protein
MGILPAELYAMELWEFNACARAFNERKRIADRRELLAAYCAANWAAAALAGKLKAFSYYYNDEQSGGRSLTREEMEEFDRKCKMKGGDAGIV